MNGCQAIIYSVNIFSEIKIMIPVYNWFFIMNMLVTYLLQYLTPAETRRLLEFVAFAKFYSSLTNEPLFRRFILISEIFYQRCGSTLNINFNSG